MCSCDWIILNNLVINDNHLQFKTSFSNTAGLHLEAETLIGRLDHEAETLTGRLDHEAEIIIGRV